MLPNGQSCLAHVYFYIYIYVIGLYRSVDPMDHFSASQATKVNESYRYGTALVRLNVIRSTQPLTFTQRSYSAAVDEDTPNGTLVATVAVVTVTIIVTTNL